MIPIFLIRKDEGLMNKIYVPENYKPCLDAYDTQRAIAYIKETFQEEFAKALNLSVSPLPCLLLKIPV